jgi:hypothetical protein
MRSKYLTLGLSACSMIGRIQCILLARRQSKFLFLLSLLSLVMMCSKVSAFPWHSGCLDGLLLYFTSRPFTISGFWQYLAGKFHTSGKVVQGWEHLCQARRTGLRGHQVPWTDFLGWKSNMLNLVSQGSVPLLSSYPDLLSKYSMISSLTGDFTCSISILDL